MSHPITVDAFDHLPPDEAGDLLHPVCASGQWVATLVAGRPFGSAAALVAASDDALAGLPWSEVEAALAAHPRIGDRPAGGGRESAFSRQEQSAAAGSDADLDAALLAGNVAYEQRFGRVFLVCATGLSRREVLDRLTIRLAADDDTERRTTRDELAAIVRLRLAKTME